MKCAKLLYALLKELSFSDTIINYIAALPDDCDFEVDHSYASRTIRIHIIRNNARIFLTKSTVCRLRNKKMMDWAIQQFLSEEPIIVTDEFRTTKELRKIVEIAIKHKLNYRQALALYRLLQK